MAISSPGSTSRTTLAPTVARAASSEATTQPRSSRPRTSGRMPSGSRAAYSVFSFIQTNEKAPLSSGSTSRARCSSEVSGWCASSAVTRPVSLVDASSVPGVHVELVLGVGELVDEAGQVVGVDQVAVVAERDGPVRGRAERRLRVLPGARPGRGVAGVADREVPLEGVERGLVEDLRDQAHVLVDEDLPPVADRDAGRLLAAVLEGVEPEVGQLGDVLARRPDAEDPTHGAESRECDGPRPASSPDPGRGFANRPPRVPLLPYVLSRP